MAQTNERAFESYVEQVLAERGGWKVGSLTEWDRERALFPAQIYAFIRDTQPKLWAEMEKLHGSGIKTTLLTPW